MARNVLVDAGFVVALLSSRDNHHEWAVTQAAEVPPPWSTCEAVLSESFHLLGGRGAASLGGDVILRHHFDAASGTLAAASPATFGTPPGAGPRHFVFHPNGQFLYLLCELDGSLHAYSYDAQTGMLDHVQTATVLPPS